jgi:1-acyl-sn-glycerol-3-phosphate acyltransferase
MTAAIKLVKSWPWNTFCIRASNIMTKEGSSGYSFPSTPMSRDVAKARLLIFLLLLSDAALGLSGGAAYGYSLRRYEFVPIAGWIFLLGLVGIALQRSFLFSRWPAIVRGARLGYSRPFIVFEVVWSLAIVAGLWNSREWARQFPLLVTAALVVSLLAMPVLAALAARRAPLQVQKPSDEFFLWRREHVADKASRKSLLATFALAVLVAGFTLGALRLDEWSEERLLHGSWLRVWEGFVIGSAIMLLQGHWYRALGFVPWSFLLLAISFTALAIWPAATWALILSGIAIAFAYAPLVVAFIVNVPPRQQFAGAFLLHVVMLVAVPVALILLMLFFPRARSSLPCYVLLAVAAALATIGFIRAVFRPFVELINEVVFRVLWMPKGYGPGMQTMPTRGPALIVANHAAMFDPVWVSGVVPLPVRAMMLSTYLDRPFLKWLCGTVYRAIRVPTEPFRRTAPEVDEAVAALKQGEAVLICPEGWLRRKEEIPLRRFANGVYLILSQAPDTPVITCWIEDNWGSWLSWKNGPPGVNKPRDRFKRIRIGINEPEVLPKEILADDWETRRYLMERVLHARTHLGLPAYPLPAFGGEEEKEEK